MSLCLRFDALKRLDINKVDSIVESERKGTTESGALSAYVSSVANSAPKHYFLAVIIGYLIAIITTIVVMFVFNHGQPALLYLVPGCLLAVAITALVKGEFKKVTEFVEEKYYGQVEEEGQDKKDK